MKQDPESLIQKIEEIMLKLNIDINELSLLLGKDINMTTLRRLFNRDSTPKLATIFKILKILDYEIILKQKNDKDHN
jgi:hypothetical protein